MVELKYVKKRKRRRIVAIATLISLLGATSLGIIAFLGRNTGTFTVALDTGKVSLSLSQSEAFTNPTSFIRVNGLQYLQQSTYADQKADELDRENSNGIESRNFFKLTFFIKNMATEIDSSVKYYMHFNITDNRRTVDSENNEYYLDDILRVRIFENDAGSSLHESETYARKKKEVLRDSEGKPIRNADGSDIWQEYLYLSNDELNTRRREHPETKTTDPTYYYGLAKNFEYSENSPDARSGTLATYKTQDFRPGEIKRYTIVCWLEGNDPECIGNGEAWDASSIKLGIQVNGYENQ